MTQPPKGAALFLALFGLPFLGAGLLFIYAQIVSRANFKPGDAILGVMVGSVFAVIGAGLIYAAIGGYGRLKKQASALAQGLGRPPRGKPKPEDRNHLLGDLHFLQHDPAPGGRRACTEDAAQR